MRFSALTTTSLCAVVTCATASTTYATVLLNDGGDHTINTVFDESFLVSNSTNLFVETGASVGRDIPDGYSLSLAGASTATLNGGEILFGSFVETGSSLILNSGSHQGDIEANSNSLVTINGGDFTDDVILQSSDLLVTGGNISGADIRSFSSNVSLEGSAFQINGEDVDFGNISQTAGILSGTLSDGSTFSTIFARFDTGSGIGDFTLISTPVVPVPDPASLALFRSWIAVVYA